MLVGWHTYNIAYFQTISTIPFIKQVLRQICRDWMTSKNGSYPEAHWFYPCTSRSKIRNQSLKYRTGRHNPPQSLKDEIKIKSVGLTLNKTQFRLLLQSTGERSKARGGSHAHLQRLETSARKLHKPSAKHNLMTPKRH